MAMKGFFEGLQSAPIAGIAPGYGLEVLSPHVRRQEVDKRCLENIFLRFLTLVEGPLGGIGAIAPGSCDVMPMGSKRFAPQDYG
jgi:hypothetical protein